MSECSFVPPKRIAIVGTSCSGLSALWALRQTEHDVHIFEASNKMGGPAGSTNIRKLASIIAMDTRVSAFNSMASPNLLAFLNEINVPTKSIGSPFALTRDDGFVEWTSSSLYGVFRPHRNIFRADMWTMLLDAFRFYYFAPDELRPRAENAENEPEETIGQYLNRNKYTLSFCENCLFPMIASLWNFCSEVSPKDMPAHSIIRLVRQHCLLDFLGPSNQWLTIDGSVRQIADAVLENFPTNRIHYNAEVTALTPYAGAVRLQVNGHTKIFDHVILAVHGDKARNMWISGEAMDTRFLSAYKSRLASAVVHSDTRFMPRDRNAWAASTYTSLSADDSPAVPNFVASVTYWMNELQGISEARHGPILMTINPYFPPNFMLTYYACDFLQPVYNATTLAGQRNQPDIQTPPQMSYCGLWTSHGYSEDGVTAGLEVVRNRLDVALPFPLRFPLREPIPALTRWDKVARVILRMLHVFVRLFRLLLYILGRIGIVERRPKEA